MSKFEIREFKKSDTFYSEYEHYNYDKNTLIGKLFKLIGMQEKYKTTKMSCASDINFIFDDKKDTDFVTVCLYKG